VDEAFMDFVLPGQQQSVIDWVGRYDNLVVLRSLTKFYRLPGLRLGYAIAQPERLRCWQQWRDPWPVNALAEAAAIAAVQAVAFQQQTWDWLGPAREALFKGLERVEGLEPLPGAANFLLVRCGVSVTALQARLLKQHRILIRDCMSFEELGDRYFRVAVRLRSENERLVAAIRQELAALRSAFGPDAGAEAESGRLEP
jgi:histidinol-phosphate/aromatic aminotransferase/cobyric acid decarboxylase-like protein